MRRAPRAGVSAALTLAFAMLATGPAPGHGVRAERAADGPPAGVPGWHDGAENVRRIAAGRQYVAFATPGGVRAWDRASDTWRLVTASDGMPTDNVYDVAFDPEAPGRLWALCGEGTDPDADPAPRLHLATVDLVRGRATRQGHPSAPAPRAPRLYDGWPDYRLAVSRGHATVSAGNRVVLAFDRLAARWLARVPADAPRARRSHLPGTGATVEDYVVSAKHAAVLLSTGIYLYDRQADVWSPRPFPVMVNAPLGAGGPVTRESLTARPGTLRFVGESGSVTFEATSFRMRQVPRQGRTEMILEHASGSFRVNPATTAIALEQQGPTYSVSSSVPTGASASSSATQPAAPVPAPAKPVAPPAAPPRPLPDIGACTDLVGDGRYLWLAGYEWPGRDRRGGIARLDMETGRWRQPRSPARPAPGKPAEREMAAPRATPGSTPGDVPLIPAN